jgi:hypothetical protein
MLSFKDLYQTISELIDRNPVIGILMVVITIIVLLVVLWVILFIIFNFLDKAFVKIRQSSGIVVDKYETVIPTTIGLPLICRYLKLYVMDKEVEVGVSGEDYEPIKIGTKTTVNFKKGRLSGKIYVRSYLLNDVLTIESNII